MSLLDDLRSADMLLIDGLHAWQFELDEQAQAEQVQLSIECMDGRTRRVWTFSAAAVAAATAGAEAGSWRIAGAEGEHELVCLGAISADNDDQDDDPDQVD
ncbi:MULTISPECIES: DUF5629 family protein [unclassified Pseudomonas]|uniref:DUF5629 family protein n=1 Tax=unclassified Pseudomonas TaxID=196821 RepID=UPI00244733EA|nr:MULTISPECIES: DUF5629 family protein [unclassified Pseudomonas]MDG9922829.1 DUF5629 family protein [Pseudomonas sp. GD04045]MDH0036890.1 DUF5629 family protein [Pseudomonas sp. GD04019]